MKEIDVYVEELEGDSVAWMEIEEAEGEIELREKGQPLKIGSVSICSIFIDGFEVFKFNVATEKLKGLL